MPQQRRAAFNERHLFLVDLLVAQGLREGSSVLELGCGIGVITSLIARRNRTGRIVAVDLSSASIEAARASLAWAGNVELVVADVVGYRAGGQTPPDFVTLFDVLEHIPAERHRELFANIARQMASTTLLVANIPNPRHIEYLEQHSPEKLQVVDQPLPADMLLRSAYGGGLELAFFVTYGLWNRDDYQVMAFRRPGPFHEHRLAPQSRLSRLVQRLLRMLCCSRQQSLLWWLGAR